MTTEDLQADTKQACDTAAETYPTPVESPLGSRFGAENDQSDAEADSVAIVRNHRAGVVVADGPDQPDYLRLILAAPVYDVAVETPLTAMPQLSARLGCNLLLKREDLQPVYSFKVRGAYNRMRRLTAEERARGVVTASAGNHAQGVALAAKKLGIHATIVMPENAAPIKWRNVQRLGAQVVLHGADMDEAQARCLALARAHQFTEIPPFDDPLVIAGQGTIAVEISRQTAPEKLHAVFCAVGGGGLISGIAVFLKRVFPHVLVIGVETFDADTMTRALQRERRVHLGRVGQFADGTAVRTVGREPFRLCSQYLDAMVRVTIDEVCTAVRDTFENTRALLEPSGALAVAGAKKWLAENPAPEGGSVVAVATGANVNFDRLAFVAERAAAADGTRALALAEVPEKPGAFRALIEAIAGHATIAECVYRRAPVHASAVARVFVSLVLDAPISGKSGAEHRAAALLQLSERAHAACGAVLWDLSDDPSAQDHARCLAAGGAAGGGFQEQPKDSMAVCVVRVTLGDRPGQLGRFFAGLDPSWDVSMVHLVATSGNVPRLLLRVHLNVSKGHKLSEYLDSCGAEWVDETSNPLYRDLLY